MFSSIGHEHLICFELQDQTVSKEVPIWGLASEFQLWKEATTTTDSFLKRYKHD